MIKVPVYNLDNRGIEIIGREPPSFLEFGNDEMLECREDIDYKLHVKLVSSGILVTGEISVALQAKCGRCLKDFSLEIKNPEVCHFFEKVTQAELDLTDDLREDILLMLPLNPVCESNCKGICPHCGVNLNKESCKCPETDNEESPWKELDNLNL